MTCFENCFNFQYAHAVIFPKRTGIIWNNLSIPSWVSIAGLPNIQQTKLLTEPLEYPLLDNGSKCFVFIPCFIGRFYNSGNECSWRNTEQLVFTKPCPQKGFMKTWKYVFQTFQFRLNLTASGTKPQFAEIFRYYFTEAEIIQSRGFRSTLNEDLKKLFISYPQDFAIWGKLAEIFIVKCDFTVKMEAWPNFRESFASEV